MGGKIRREREKVRGRRKARGKGEKSEEGARVRETRRGSGRESGRGALLERVALDNFAHTTHKNVPHSQQDYADIVQTTVSMKKA